MSKLLNNTIGAKAFLMVNKLIAHKVGFKAALFLAHLIYKHSYWQARGELEPDGSFYNVSEDIEEETGLTRYMRLNATKKLKAAGFLTTYERGMPCTLYYKIQDDAIESFLNQNEPSKVETDVHVRGKLATTNKQSVLGKKIKDEMITSSDQYNTVWQDRCKALGELAKKFSKPDAAKMFKEVITSCRDEDDLRKVESRESGWSQLELFKKYEYELNALESGIADTIEIPIEQPECEDTQEDDTNHAKIMMATGKFKIITPEQLAEMAKRGREDE